MDTNPTADKEWLEEKLTELRRVQRIKIVDGEPVEDFSDIIELLTIWRDEYAAAEFKRGEKAGEAKGRREEIELLLEALRGKWQLDEAISVLRMRLAALDSVEEAE